MANANVDKSDDHKKAEEALLEQLRKEVQERRKTPLRDADQDAALRAALDSPTVVKKREVNIRGQVLETTNNLVNGDRNNQYGDPRQDFQRTADYFTTYLNSVIEREHGELLVRPHDIGILQILLKVSRLSWTPAKADHYYDIAGYAACAADCADAEYEGLE